MYLLRKAFFGDAEGMSELDYKLFPGNNLNEKTIRDQLEQGGGSVVYNFGHLAGYVIWHNSGGLVDILRLGVAEVHRNRGLGKILLKESMRVSTNAMLTVKRDNQSAINLYRKNGFRITGMMPQANCWVMRCP